MRIVLGNHQLASVSGAETYLLTVAEQLGRLGHEVTIHGDDDGAVADLARDRGLHVAVGEDGLPESCDAVIAQDASISLTLAALYPGVSQLFIAHSVNLEMWFPSAIPGVVTAVVVMNDRLRRRIDGMAGNYEVVRMRQPIDLRRFSARDEPRRVPRRALALGNYLHGPHREGLARACSESGIELVETGRHGVADLHPERRIREADLVVGYGRSLLEAMACGRAAYVLDEYGGDGWVTPETYSALEADGFAAGAYEMPLDTGRLREDLRRYDRAMGLDNRELIRRNHNALEHSADLVALIKRLLARAGTPASDLTEVARLTRSQWEADRRAADLRVENKELHRRLEAAEARAKAAEARADAAEARVEPRGAAAEA